MSWDLMCMKICAWIECLLTGRLHFVFVFVFVFSWRGECRLESKKLMERVRVLEETVKELCGLLTKASPQGSPTWILENGYPLDIQNGPTKPSKWLAPASGGHVSSLTKLPCEDLTDTFCKLWQSGSHAWYCLFLIIKAWAKPFTSNAWKGTQRCPRQLARNRRCATTPSSSQRKGKSAKGRMIDFLAVWFTHVFMLDLCK